MLHFVTILNDYLVKRIRTKSTQRKCHRYHGRQKVENAVSEMPSFVPGLFPEFELGEEVAHIVEREHKHALQEDINHLYSTCLGLNRTPSLLAPLDKDEVWDQNKGK